MKYLHTVGARPNFMKAAPVLRALEQSGEAQQLVVHTGQHYDYNMSGVFFEQLGMRPPDVNLEVGGGSQAVQTAEIMRRFEAVAEREEPDWVVVYGDVNSTLAATLVSVKLGIRVAHVEAGLRSHDRTMPEEINRIVTDQLADLLFTPSRDGNENLAREGISPGRIRFVGNVMIDTLIRLLPRAAAPVACRLEKRYVLVTLHRPSNVDRPAKLRAIAETLRELSNDVQVIFPIHPRTRARLSESGFEWKAESRRLLLIEPVGYLECLALQRDAACVVTDSGGIQEETTYLGVRCLTMRENTERPVTISEGTNRLIGSDTVGLREEVRAALAGDARSAGRPELWDGNAGARIAAILSEGISSERPLPPRKAGVEVMSQRRASD